MGKNSGRRSAADLHSARFSRAIAPTRKLYAAEQKVWDRVVCAWPADHWIGSDTEALTRYCALAVAFENARKRDDLSAMKAAGALLLQHERSLRITPQSRYDARAAAREAEHGRENEAGADRLLGGSAWENPSLTRN